MRHVCLGTDEEGNKLVNEYIIIKTIGKGSFCKVKATRLLNNPSLSVPTLLSASSLLYPESAITISRHLANHLSPPHHYAPSLLRAQLLAELLSFHSTTKSCASTLGIMSSMYVCFGRERALGCYEITLLLT